jgi:hypothetical protein
MVQTSEPKMSFPVALASLAAGGACWETYYYAADGNRWLGRPQQKSSARSLYIGFRINGNNVFQYIL